MPKYRLTTTFLGKRISCTIEANSQREAIDKLHRQLVVESVEELPEPGRAGADGQLDAIKRAFGWAGLRL